MPTLTALTRLDWALIRRNALLAGVTVLAEAARRRTSASAQAIRHTEIAEGHAQVQVHDPALVARERGATGLPPAPFLAPNHSDRAALRAAMMHSLRKDLP